MSDIRITSISNAEDTDAEKLTASSTEFDVVTGVVVDTSAAQHSVVLDFRATKRGAVRADDNELSCIMKFKVKSLNKLKVKRSVNNCSKMDESTFSLTNALQSRLVTQAILTTLHDKSKARVDGLNGLLLLLR